MLTLEGACLCGKARYEVRDAFEYAMNCHCSQCRRTTGSAFKPIAGIRRDEWRLACAPDETQRYGGGTEHDIRCRSCGSFIASLVRGGEYVHVAMGTLLDAPGIRPQCHIFVGSKAPWFEITDDLPQFDTLPDA